MSLADLLHPAAEFAWRLALKGAGRLLRPEVARFTPAGKGAVLVIAPHPDDEAIGCAGTILLHRRSGDEVCIACITDGSRSRAGGLDITQMKCRREREARAASALMGVNHLEWFGLAEGSWKFEDLSAPLTALLHRLEPRIIYAPSRIDFHPEHRRVACSLARVLAGETTRLVSLTIRIYQLQVPLTPMLTNLAVDCSNAITDAAAAISAYSSQSSNLGRAFRQRRYTAAFYGFALEGEEFWQISAAHYCQLHSGEADGLQDSRFRGTRYRPFTDPLAYVIGLRERRRLKRCLNGTTQVIPHGHRSQRR
jgi:LmbE family N-acetylglucosaminyl deacetylase